MPWRRSGDADGRILVPGFYDDIKPATPKEQAATVRLPDEGPSWKATFGADSFVGGVEGDELKTDLLFNPTANIAACCPGTPVRE